jgi:hypothetical protein
MATVSSVVQPYAVFTDREGDPLEDGNVYVGTAGLNPRIAANQVAVFADSALTIPIAQPIRTVGGVMVNSNGSPTYIYVAGSTYSILITDKNGSLVYSALYAPQVSQDIASVNSSNIKYDITPLEFAQGVVPPNLQYPPGAFRRYGMDPTGVTPSDTQYANCLKCNAYCYDDYPGGGSYLFNVGVTISSCPITILGQSALAIGNNIVVQGTLFTLATVAGAGASIMKSTAFLASVNIQRIGFAFQSQNLGQSALRFMQDFRYSDISRCVFQAAGTAGQSTNIGILCDGGGTYSGATSIHNNFFYAGLKRAIHFKGNCTTFKVYANEFYGYSGNASVEVLGAITAGAGYVNGVYHDVPLTGGTGTGAEAEITVAGNVVTQVLITMGGNNYTPADVLSAAAASIGGAGAGFSVPVTTVGNNNGVGVQCDYPVTEPVLSMNYFEGWTSGIYGNGSAYLKQSVNDFAVCTRPWTWLKRQGGYGNEGNQSFGDSLVGLAGTPYYSTVEADQNIVVGFGGYFFPGQAVQSTRGFQEGSGPGTGLRPFNMGYIVTQPFNAADFTGFGAMTWTVGAGNVTTFRWAVVGKMMTVWLNIGGSTVGGAVNVALLIAIPGGFQAAASVGNSVPIQNNGAFTSAGFVDVVSGGSVIRVFRDATTATNWTASANTGMNLTFTFPIA